MPSLSDVGPRFVTVPEAALKEARVIAQRCGRIRSEALRAQAEAAASHERGDMMKATTAERKMQSAQRRYKSCLADVERVAKEAIAESRREAMKIKAFEGIPWGAPPDTVQSSLGDPAVKQDGTLCYREETAGLPAYACFYFEKNGLSHGRYIFLQQHDTPSAYVQDFNRIADDLAAVYGMPVYDEEQWARPYEEGEKPGPAIATGECTRVAQWKTPGGRVAMQLRGGNGAITQVLEIEPTSK